MIASVLLHGLLVFVLVFGTAFLGSKKEIVDAPHIIDLLPGMTVTDGKSHGGGGAPVPAIPPPAPVAQKQLDPLPPKPEPKPEPERAKPVIEPPKPKPVAKETISELPTPKAKKTKEKPAPVEKPKPTLKPAPAKPVVDISKVIVRDNKEKKAAAEAAERAAEKSAQERSRNQRLAAVAGARRSLENNLSASSAIEGLGSAGGAGAAEINYRDLVFSKYEAAWLAPMDVEDDDAITKARVVIGRSGKVISSEVIKNSGNAKLDRSVRQVLDTLNYIAPFPDGSRESTRTFIINFNLKSKRGLG
ncbi:MAG: TonB C-terminal domain-containing protein [Verrucomicrobiota bacterium]